MTRITEDYVSFEVAKLLKDKGFNEKCSCWYVANEPQEGIVEKGFGENQFYINAPTLQMAMKWLREIKNICISVDIKIGGREYYIAISDIRSGLSFGALEDEICVTYEEACEAAIKYCLENLI